MLLSGIAIEIGAVAAKIVCKLWLKNVVGGDDISESVVDLLKSKTSDVFTQRQGRRLFERIGDKISNEILPVLEEGSGLDEGERNAIAIAVTATLSKAKLTNDLLLKYNLQPIELKKHLMAVDPSTTRDFSANGTYLYERIIEEVCTYIIDITRQLPGFTEQTITEVLQREDYIASKVDEAIKELRLIREGLSPAKKADRFEKGYREAVARKLNVLQLIGTEVSAPSRRYPLNVAYISLSALQQNTRYRNTLSLSHKELNEQTRSIVSAETLLLSAQRLLVLGPAGSGKTTLLQWIAVRTATKSFPDELNEWNQYLPFYIRLRHYVTTDLPSPEEFPRFAASEILGEMPSEWVHTMLRSGRAVLLVDGIDEMSLSRREEVQIWLRALIETYPNCHFIVTSRHHAIEAGWMNHTPFETASLQEMTLADINKFIDHWHKAVKEELSIEEEKDKLTPQAEHLKEQIRRTRSLRKLATNPLLCAMLCALHREHGQQLPVNRVELYQACSSLLLERREKDRRIDLSDYPSLFYSQKERLLTYLANNMTKKNLTEAEAEYVDSSFTHLLLNMPNIPPDTTGRSVRCLFVERSGLIREPVLGQIDFAHRSFQEFYTALASVNSIRYLISHAHLDQWREVIILTAGLVRRAQCEQLIKGLLQRGDQEKRYQYQLHLLAMSCLETTVELSEEIRGEIEKRFRQLIPPKNMIEAKALASAEELVLKYLGIQQLSAQGRLFVATCAACVRTLALVSGEAALAMLEEYALDTRKMVRDELLLAWDKFDRESYAKRILTKALQSTQPLMLEGSSSLEGIWYLSNLTELWLINTQITDLTPLTGLSNLTTLWLDNTQITDLTPLTSLSNLTTLSLYNTQITDLTPLTSLSNLTTLRLRNTQITDLTPLTSLSNLTELWLRNTQITDLTPLTSLSNLTTLRLDNTQVTDLTLLTSLSNLTELSLYNIQITDLTPLTGLSNLTTLRLDNIQITDLTPLTGLSNLTELWLINTQITDLAPLTGLSNLTELWLRNTQVTDLTPLTGLSNLTGLWLDNTQITDLTPLTSLSNLTELWLNNTQATDLTPLTSLSNLEYINLADF
jgi:Leucine-rich repeat (LRR) protein